MTASNCSGAFQPTPPARAATSNGLPAPRRPLVSTHAARAGGDRHPRPNLTEGRRSFNPRRPRGRRPSGWIGRRPRCSFNPRRPRGRRRACPAAFTAPLAAFQPTPPARAATQLRHLRPQRLRVSTHAARAGGDVPAGVVTAAVAGFQPTPPARAATRRPSLTLTGTSRFNPRRPRGRRRNDPNGWQMSRWFQPTPPARAATHLVRESSARVKVSTHAARAGGDLRWSAALGAWTGFNPRRPRGRRPGEVWMYFSGDAKVSTHAARAGGDDRRCRRWTATAPSFNPRRPRGRRPPTGRVHGGPELGFNPRRPRGRRLSAPTHGYPPTRFQPTPPARAATCQVFCLDRRPGVSTHAARAGGDPGALHRRDGRGGSFNPRRPRGRRRADLQPDAATSRRVSTHAARAGGDRRIRTFFARPFRFQPTPPARAATGWRWRRWTTAPLFQPTPPARAATRPGSDVRDGGRVSTHAARAGGDPGGQHRDVVLHPVSTHAARAGGDLVVHDEPHQVVVSTHAARAGGDASYRQWGSCQSRFQPTPPARAATGCLATSLPGRRGFNPRRPRGRRRESTRQPFEPCYLVSTHAARAGGDERLTEPEQRHDDGFNPRRPRGRRPDRALRLHPPGRCFNPRRPRGRRLATPTRQCRLVVVSTHAARAGGDRLARRLALAKAAFQPTPPARAATCRVGLQIRTANRFQPTPPARAATGGTGNRPAAERFQPTPPARAATWVESSSRFTPFQPTPPARAATRRSRQQDAATRRFQPTPPARAATESAKIVGFRRHVSTHAARAGGDVGRDHRVLRCREVSTHAARAGGDRKVLDFDSDAAKFQPTPPARAATKRRNLATQVCRGFNPRRPRGRRPARSLTRPRGTWEFQPTPPARAATPLPGCLPAPMTRFNPRRPRGRRPRRKTEPDAVDRFNPRRPRGRRPRPSAAPGRFERFQPTPPARAATGRSAGRPRQPSCFNPRRPRGRRPSLQLLVRGSLPFQPTPPARAATCCWCRSC